MSRNASVRRADFLLKDALASIEEQCAIEFEATRDVMHMRVASLELQDVPCEQVVSDVLPAMVDVTKLSAERYGLRRLRAEATSRRKPHADAIPSEVTAQDLLAKALTRCWRQVGSYPVALAGASGKELGELLRSCGASNDDEALESERLCYWSDGVTVEWAWLRADGSRIVKSAGGGGAVSTISEPGARPGCL